MRKIFLAFLGIIAVRLAARAFRRQAETAGLLWAVIAATCGVTANTSKAVSTEARLNTLIPALGSLTSRIAALETGTFVNVSSGNTVTLVTASPGNLTLHAGALANLTSGPNTAFLAGLSQIPHISGVAVDPFSGGSFGTNERGLYITPLQNNWNNLIPELIAIGFMAP